MDEQKEEWYSEKTFQAIGQRAKIHENTMELKHALYCPPPSPFPTPLTTLSQYTTHSAYSLTIPIALYFSGVHPPRLRLGHTHLTPMLEEMKLCGH